MQVLTPTGYVDINDLNVGDEVIAYDINDGHLFTNILEAKTKWTYDMLPAVPPVYELDAEGNIVYDEDGNPVILEPGKTSEQVFQETYGDWKFYLINNTWVLYCNQSVWANMNVTHASQLQLGDIVYDDQNQDVVITSIEEVTAPDWWRLQVSGDHSYIADNLTLHNASRYWVGGGSSSNWNATGNTNWGSTSGGTNNASVPVSTDDVTFDAGGPTSNTNSTISSTASILSLNITSAYTSTMTHNALLVIAGNWTYTGNYVIAGIAGVQISATSTITSNGITWPNALTFINAITVTLSGNLTVNGLVTFTNTTTINSTTTESITCAGGLSHGFITNGTAKIILSGGTWSDSNNYGMSNPLDINGNVTISGNVNYGYTPNANTVFTYVSGTVTVTGSTFILRGSCTLNSNGIAWNNVTVAGGIVITFTSNITANGLFSSTSGFPSLFKTTSETATLNGGLSVGGTLQGNLNIYLTGGTWSGTGTLGLNIYLNGNSTISSAGVIKSGGSINYVSGTITTTGSTLTINASISGAITLNTNGITWNNVTFATSGPTLTLTSNFACSGLVTVSVATIINTSVGSTFTSGGGVSITGTLLGTAKVILTGGTWSSINYIANNLDINGNVTISGFVYYRTGTLKYISGTITTTGSTLYIQTSITLDTNTMAWNNILCADNAQTITLASNLLVNGLFQNDLNTVINRTINETATFSGGLTTNANLTGTAECYAIGGTLNANSVGLITNNLFINGNVTVATLRYQTGTLTYLSGTVTTTGSTLSITNSCTLNTNGITWNNVIFPSNSGTYTLTSNFACSGLVTVSVATIINTSVGSTFTSGGGLTMNNTLGGTAKIILTGGTWSGGSFLSNNFDIQGNVTISGSVAYGTGTMTYVSGTVTTTGSTLIGYTSTLNTNGIPWNNVSMQVGTMTLTSNLNVYGTINYTNSGFSYINKTTSEVVNIYGTLSASYFVRGTASYYLLNGSTWAGGGGLEVNLFINGDCTVSGTVRYGYINACTMTYLSGNVATGNSTLSLYGSGNVIVIDTKGIVWNNIGFGTTGQLILNVISDLTAAGYLYMSPFNLNIYTSTNATITTFGGLYIAINNDRTVIGGMTYIIKGGVLSCISHLSFAGNIVIDGNVTMTGTLNLEGYSIRYVKGIVNAITASLYLRATCSVLGFSKVPLRSVLIAASITVGMDSFFTGVPSRACIVSSTSTAANYTISFTDGFEKIGRYVNVTGATITNSQQLLIISNPRFNTNRSTNAPRIRYTNQSPNGAPKNSPSIADTMTVPALGLVNDPCFQYA